MAYQEDIDLANDYLYEWIESTENIIGATMVKKKVKFSDNEQQNIRIELRSLAENVYEMIYRVRPDLRFPDMGAGRGWNKGVRQKSSRQSENTSRKPKKILTKPFFSRLNSLQSVLVSSVTEMAEFKIEKFKELTNIANGN